VELVKSKYEDFSIPDIKDVVLGLIYTGVRLVDDTIGVCHSFINLYSPNCFFTNDWDELSSYRLSELINFCESDKLIDRVIGISALNAYSQHIFNKKVYKLDFKHGVLDRLGLTKSDTVGMVGRFTPMIPKIVPKVKTLTIIEIDPEKLSKAYQNVEIVNDPTVLEDVDIAIITGTSIINHTIDKLLKLAQNARIAMIGPTMGMLPGPFFDAGVDIIGGMRFVNSDEVMKVLSQGGGTMRFKKFAKKYIIEKDGY